MKKKILFIINPISGTGKQIKAETEIKKWLDLSKFDSEIMFTRHKGHFTSLAKNAAEKDFDAVIAVGGDGSANEAAQGLIGTKTALGIIPIGSGNGFARHLNIPMSLRYAVEKINQFNTKRIDTAAINNHAFISISGLGFDAHIAEKFSLSKRRGLGNYAKISFREFFYYPEKKYKISLDGKAFEKNAFMLVFANANQFGNDFIIAPEAKINDGLLDVCFVGKPKLFQIPYILFKVFKKNIHQTKFVHIKRAKQIKVEFNGNAVINIDGEAITLNGPLHITTNPLSLSVIS